MNDLIRIAKEIDKQYFPINFDLKLKKELEKVRK
jgi:hypothetical protein